MAFTDDPFTDTAGTVLTAHTEPIGGAVWTQHTSYGSGSVVVSDANRIRTNNASAAGYYAPGVPPSADYDVTGVFRYLTTVNSLGFCGRMSTSADTFYWVRRTGTDWQLFKFLAGVSTQLGTFASTLVAGTDYTLKLEMRGTTLNVYVDGVLRIGPVTDTDISAAGRVGVRAVASTTQSNTTGLHIDQLTAVDAGATTGSQFRMVI